MVHLDLRLSHFNPYFIDVLRENIVPLGVLLLVQLRDRHERLGHTSSTNEGHCRLRAFQNEEIRMCKRGSLIHKILRKISPLNIFYEPKNLTVIIIYDASIDSIADYIQSFLD